MNYVTRDIMFHLQVSAEIALQIQEVMDRSDIDLSECTDQEYLRAIYDSYVIYTEENKY